MKQQKFYVRKMMVVIGCMISMLVTSVTAKAETTVYGIDIKNTAEDLSLCIKQGETEVIAYYEESGNSALTQMFLGTDFLQLGLPGSVQMDYYWNNLYGMTWYDQKYSTNRGQYYTKIQMTYRETPEETTLVKQSVDTLIAGYADSIRKMSTAQKYAWIYDIICRNIEYDDSLQNTSAYEGLATGKTTCTGYAGLYYLFAAKMGLPCKIVQGKADGSGHVWNLAKVGGKWYYVDATWGDSTGKNYLLRAKNTVKSHKLDTGFGKDEKGKTLTFATKDYGIVQIPEY